MTVIRTTPLGAVPKKGIASHVRISSNSQELVLFTLYCDTCAIAASKRINTALESSGHACAIEAVALPPLPLRYCEDCLAYVDFR